MSSSTVWVGDGRPGEPFSGGKVVLEATISRQPESVLGVIDMLAVADPLEIDTLCTLTDPTAVEEVEQAGLLNLASGADPALARLIHPLLGEVRRTHYAPAAVLRAAFRNRKRTGRLRGQHKPLVSERGT